MKKITYLAAIAIVLNLTTASGSAIETTVKTSETTQSSSTTVTMDDAVVMDAMSQFKSL